VTDPTVDQTVSEVQVRTEDLYTSFARYAPVWPIRISPLKDPRELHPLRKKALRSLVADDLASFSGSAVWTMGTVDDLKYFYPRIVELKVAPEVDGLARWGSLAERLMMGLTPDELGAVSRLHEALWSAAMVDYWANVFLDAGDVLEACAHLDMDVSRLCESFAACRHRPAAQQLFDLCCYTGADAARPVVDWVLQAHTVELLKDAQHAFPPAPGSQDETNAGLAIERLMRARREGTLT
jgi:hypothetical protein